MNDYSEMSDFEINKMVAFLNGIAPDEEQYHSHGDRSDGVLHCNGEKVVDYCNDARDMWPLIVENKIDVCFIDSASLWTSFGLTKNKLLVESSGDNPLRAAAIVYLMIKDEE